MAGNSAPRIASNRFSLPFRLIHWIMALIILVMLIAGQGFGVDMAEADRISSLMAHSSLGITVVLLLALRVVLRVTGGAQRPQHNLEPWQEFASKSVQAAIYLLLVFIPATGFAIARTHELPVQPFGMASISVSDPVMFDQLRPLHEYGTKALMLLLVLHIGAALMHRFVQKDGVMQSMSLFKPRS